MQGTCKLCGEYSTLKKSHFIPKFVGNWIKKTSPTGYIRESGKEHKRQQDLVKEYWLCGQCESLFSKWEDRFAREIFYPCIDKKEDNIKYEGWLIRFCASLSWRSLTYIGSINEHENTSAEYRQEIEKAKVNLAKFLLGETQTPNRYEQHIFLLPRVKFSASNDIPTNINRYMSRTVGMDIVDNEISILSYAKLPDIIILGLVKLESTSKMRASRVSLNVGKLWEKQYFLPHGFEYYIFQKAKEISDSYGRIPSRQRQRISDFIMDNPDKVANSKSFEAFEHDHALFGRKVFRNQH